MKINFVNLGNIVSLILCILFTLYLVSSILAQPNAGYPSSVYISGSGRSRSPNEVSLMKKIYDNEIRNRQFERLNNLRQINENNGNGSGYMGTISIAFYNKEQKKLIDELSEPNQVENAKYGQFLRQSKTGFVTLLGESNCVPKTDENNLLKYDKDCLNMILPGNGNYYSFRTKNYSRSNLSDVGTLNSWMFGIGYLTTSIFVELGDIEIEDITIQSKGMKFLFDFVPAVTPELADQQLAEFEDGVQSDNFNYAKAIRILPGKTYALRSIAYRGNVPYIVQIGRNKRTINLLRGDERKDIIVCFQVIDINEKGKVKFIWRELQSKNVNKLELNN